MTLHWDAYDFQEFLPTGGCQARLALYRHQTTNAYAVSKHFEPCVDRSLRYQRELSALKSLQGHGVPKLLSWMGLEYALLMEKLDCDLYAYKVRSTKIGEAELCGFMVQIVNCLEAAHRKNIYHFDIKLSNIFIRGNQAFLGDWGVCYIAEDCSSLPNSQTGTGLNGPPELRGKDRSQFSNKQCEEWDIYTLGALLYWGMDPNPNVHSPPPTTLPHGSTALRALYARLLHPDRDQRLADLAVIRMLLQQQSHPTPAVALPTLNRSPLPRLVISAGLAISLVIVLLLKYTPSRPEPVQLNIVNQQGVISNSPGATVNFNSSASTPSSVEK